LLTANGWEPELIFVRWRGGVWKVVDVYPVTNRYFLRWVKGSRPDRGVLHWVARSDTTPLPDMEVIALMTDEKIAP
jgi:hypothetical protein